MPLELIITNIAFAFTFLVCLGLGIFVYIRRPKEKGSVNIIFFINTCVMCLWQASYVIGVNIHDPMLSRFVFMFNLAALFAVLMNVHLALEIGGRFQKQKKFMMLLYGIGIVFAVFFAFNPDLFLLPSKPQLYLPNFFVIGPLYAVQDTFFSFVLIYLFVQLALIYHTGDIQMRNRMKYFILGMVYVYSTSLTAEFLLYGIQIDPIITSLTGLYTIPMAYAIIKYDLIDINLIARRALIYALGTAGITLFILLIGYANDTITAVVPGFPEWVLPFISGIIGVSVGFFIWKKIKEVDYLKFQFVDVVTHKFRTPLTHIKWSAELLRSAVDPKERTEAVATIEDANVRLFEMTNSLIGLSRSDENQYQYVYSSENLNNMLKETLSAVESQIRSKKINIQMRVADDLPDVYVDRKRVQFVMQMIIENSIIYSPQGSIVEIIVEKRKNFLDLSVRDFGIGISKEDMSHLFSRFFRGSNAAESYTEGLGIGLFVSRDIMKRHGGDLSVESAGLGKGSTFTMKIPIKS